MARKKKQAEPKATAATIVNRSDKTMSVALSCGRITVNAGSSVPLTGEQAEAMRAVFAAPWLQRFAGVLTLESAGE